MTNWVTRSVNLVPWWLRDHVRKIPFLSGCQRLIVKYFLVGKTFSYEINAGPAKGLIFPITLPDDKLIWTGTWEKKVTAKIYSSVKKGMPSYDIGSHRGFMAGIMALAESNNVCCFEPNPENIRHLNKLKKLNTKLPLTIFPYAIAAENGVAEFALMPESSMGKLSESSFQPEAKRGVSIKVEMKALDELLASGEIEPPGFIKIDVEGAELLVLEGAKKLIELYSPNFVIELHAFSLAHKCQNFLMKCGYKIEIIQKEIDLTDESKFRVCHLLATKL